MKIPLKNSNGQDQGELEITFPLVENGRGTQAVHDVVVAHQANQRMGTACTKTMGDVAGTGKKPYRQKGTGFARAGSFQSPIWRGGGVVFGPKPRDFSIHIPRQTRQLALRKALTERIKAGDVMVLDGVKLDSPKTKGMAALLEKLGVTGTVVLVLSGLSENVKLASRNLSQIEITSGDILNTYQVLRPSKLVFDRASFDKVQERLTE